MRCAEKLLEGSNDDDNERIVKELSPRPLCFLQQQAGTVIVQQGEPLTQDSKFYIVEQGQLECYRRVATGDDRHVVKHLSKGSWFGELALLTKAPRQADVTTTTKVKVSGGGWCARDVTLRHSCWQ